MFGLVCALDVQVNVIWLHLERITAVKLNANHSGERKCELHKHTVSRTSCVLCNEKDKLPAGSLDFFGGEGGSHF